MDRCTRQGEECSLEESHDLKKKNGRSSEYINKVPDRILNINVVSVCINYKSPKVLFMRFGTTISQKKFKYIKLLIYTARFHLDPAYTQCNLCTYCSVVTLLCRQSDWITKTFRFLIKLSLFGFLPNIASLIKQKYWFKKLLRNRKENATRRETPRCAASLENMPLTTWKLNDALLSHSSREEQLPLEVCNLHRNTSRNY